MVDWGSPRFLLQVFICMCFFKPSIEVKGHNIGHNDLLLIYLTSDTSLSPRFNRHSVHFCFWNTTVSPQFNFHCTMRFCPKQSIRISKQSYCLYKNVLVHLLIIHLVYSQVFDICLLRIVLYTYEVLIWTSQVSNIGMNLFTESEFRIKYLSSVLNTS